MVMERWFFSFFWLSSSRGRSHSCSHARSSNYCVCDGVCTHTHLLHVHFLVYIHCAYTSHILMRVTHMHACHFSLDSPSHFSCFTRPYLCLPCCSLTVTSRPLLEAQVKRTPHDELFGYLAKSALNRGYEPKKFDKITSVDNDTTLTDDIYDFFEIHRKNIGQFGVSAVFEFSVSHVSHWWFCFSERKQRKHATGKQLLDREEEKKEKVLWSVLQGWCQWKVDGTRIRSHSPTTHRQFDSDDRDLRVHLEWRAQQASLGENSAQKKDTRLNTTRRSKIRNEEIQNTQYLSHNENMNLKEDISCADQAQCERIHSWSYWRWRIVLTRIASQEVAKILKSWEYAAIRKKILKNNKDWNNFFMQDDENHVQSVYSSTILTYWAVVTDLRSSSSCYLEFVESFAAKLECHEIHKNIWGIPGNAFDCQHARRDPDASHNDSRNLATLLGILRTEGIEESESEEPSQSTPLFCS